jgi:plastocyanin
MRRLVVVLPLLLAGLLVAPVSRPSPVRVAAQDEKAEVQIQDFAFSPDRLEVTVGTTVTWTNTGQAPHTVTSDDGLFDSGELANGNTFNFTFDKAGEFAYHCNIHPKMTATIVVKEAETAAKTPASSSKPKGKSITIKDFAFSSASVKIPVGTTVTWTNKGDVPHTVTSDDGLFDSGTLNKGDTFKATFKEAGTFAYHCEIHPAKMTAKIVVTEAQAAPTEAPTEAATEAPTEAATEQPAAQASPVASEAPSGTPTIVGGAADGSNALEFVGRVDQRGDDLTVYGYLTAIAGLDRAALFGDPDPTKWNEATARFTFFGSAKATSRATVGGADGAVIAVTGDGTLDFYLSTKGGASFDVPESFFSGTKIAESAVTLHSALAVYEPNKGIADADGILQWTSDDPFTLDGQTYQLGATGGRHRLTYHGFGTLQDPNGPRSTTLIAGSSVSQARPAGGGTGQGGNATGGNVVTVKLDTLNDSGISGTATLTANGDQTRVVLKLNGATGGHPAHIHQGTCNELDPNPLYPLQEVDADGNSDTTIDVKLADLQSAPFAINVHKSADEIGVYVACGNIPS